MDLRKIILMAFVLSGMTALIYEVTWIRPLQLIFGMTIYAISTMLATFMFGFAFGSYAFRNIADNIKNPARLFAGLELGIGLYGLIILKLFSLLSKVYLNLLGVSGFQFLQFVLVSSVLIIPAVLFGATWPVVNKAYSKINGLGKDSGLLYSFNSFGAAAGSICAGFLLIPLFGIKFSVMATAFVNLLIGVIILIYLWRKNGS